MGRSALTMLRSRRAVGWLRAIVIALLFPLASGGTLPVLARLVGVEGPHVCRCAADHHDCVCTRCNPDRKDLRLTGESVKGQCGDDEVVFGGKALVAVCDSPFVVPPRTSLRRDAVILHPLEGRAHDPPRPRPPRS